MLKQPELTVIITAYNVEKYLARALDHLVRQTDRNFKLLIVNDGSNDQTAQIASSYAAKFQYFKLINKKNGGISEARNVGLDNVDTPYFTFHDGDDWVDADYTANFMKLFHNHPEAALVTCGFYIDDEKKQNSIPAGKKKIHAFLSKKEAYRLVVNPMGSFFMNKFLVSPVKGYTWNKCYKISVVRKNNLRFVKKLTFMEDEIFTIKYISLTTGIYCSSTPFYHYCQRDDSIIHSFNLKMVPDNFRANYIMWKIIIKSMWENHWQKPKRIKQDLISVNEGNSNDRKG